MYKEIHVHMHHRSSELRLPFPSSTSPLWPPPLIWPPRNTNSTRGRNRACYFNLEQLELQHLNLETPRLNISDHQNVRFSGLDIDNTSGFNSPKPGGTRSTREFVVPEFLTTRKTRFTDFHDQPSPPQSLDHSLTIFPELHEHLSTSRRNLNLPNPWYYQKFPKMQNLLNPKLLPNSIPKNRDLGFKNQVFD